jgi:hypothetical protein
LKVVSNRQPEDAIHACSWPAGSIPGPRHWQKWSLDRFSREGMVPRIMYLQRLASYGVSFHSYTEARLVTDNENILLSVMCFDYEPVLVMLGELARGADYLVG